jgi:hypothetical protein
LRQNVERICVQMTKTGLHMKHENRSPRDAERVNDEVQFHRDHHRRRILQLDRLNNVVSGESSDSPFSLAGSQGWPLSQRIERAGRHVPGQRYRGYGHRAEKSRTHYLQAWITENGKSDQTGRRHGCPWFRKPFKHTARRWSKIRRCVCPGSGFRNQMILNADLERGMFWVRGGLSHSPLVRYFIDGVRSLSKRISHFRKLLISPRFALATHVITNPSSINPSTGMGSGMRSSGLTK